MHDDRNLAAPAVLAAIEADTRAIRFGMASEPRTGALLRTLAAAKPAGQMLELGTGTGLATAWLLSGMDESARLLTVDSDERVLAVARRHLAGDPRLTIRAGDGNDVIATLAGRRFDLIFADTWAGKYESLEATLALLAPGGIYVVDDMLPQPNWPDGHAPKVARLVETMEQRSDLSMVKLSWASGIVIAARIPVR